MTPHHTQILELHDEGNSPLQIATTLPVSLSLVYAVLREHRPKRKRSPRMRTSAKPGQIRGLASIGTAAPRIAFLLGVSNAYVYKVLSQA